MEEQKRPADRADAMAAAAKKTMGHVGALAYELNRAEYGLSNAIARSRALHLVAWPTSCSPWRAAWSGRRPRCSRPSLWRRAPCLATRMRRAPPLGMLSAWWRYCVDAAVLADAAPVDAVTQSELSTGLGGLLPDQVQIDRAALVAAMPQRVVARKALELELALLKGLLQRKALRLKLLRTGLRVGLQALRVRHLGAQQVKMLGEDLVRCRFCHERLDRFDDAFQVRHRLNLRVWLWALWGR